MVLESVYTLFKGGRPIQLGMSTKPKQGGNHTTSHAHGKIFRRQGWPSVMKFWPQSIWFLPKNTSIINTIITIKKTRQPPKETKRKGAALIFHVDMNIDIFKWPCLWKRLSHNLLRCNDFRGNNAWRNNKSPPQSLRILTFLIVKTENGKREENTWHTSTTPNHYSNGADFMDQTALRPGKLYFLKSGAAIE